MDEIEKLIVEGKTERAAKLIDAALRRNAESDRNWYLRGICCIKNKNYQDALECLERAVSINNRPEYHKAIGMCFMEMYEFEEAIDELTACIAEKRDAEAYFLLAVCYIFLDLPESKRYMEYAYLADSKKTKELIKHFFMVFIRDNPELDHKRISEIEQKINLIK